MQDPLLVGGGWRPAGGVDDVRSGARLRLRLYRGGLTRDVLADGRRSEGGVESSAAEDRIISSLTMISS